MRFYLTSLGCKLNQAEMDELGRSLLTRGSSLVDRPEDADCCVLNSCTVTGVAAGKSRRKVRQLLRRSPQANIVITGCHATQEPRELLELSPRVRIVHNLAKDRLLEMLLAGAPTAPICSQVEASPHRTRAFVKVQDGCNNRCAYCVVRIARGSQHSRPLEEVVQEVRRRVDEGRQEVVLTGVHVGAYGQDLGLRLVDLVQAILQSTAVRRLRLSSVEPHDLSSDLLALWEDRRLCRHLHLPLQSGSSRTLERMDRRYSAEAFRQWVTEARAAIAGLAVTTDVMVAFPGETDEAHAESLAFVRELAFARTHVFTFSPRPGTPAAGFPDQVSPLVAQERHREMAEVGRQSAERFAAGFVAHDLEALFEQHHGPLQGGRAWWSGLTDNYLRVWTQESRSLHNQIELVRIVGRDGDRLIATLAGRDRSDGLQGEA